VSASWRSYTGTVLQYLLRVLHTVINDSEQDNTESNGSKLQSVDHELSQHAYAYQRDKVSKKESNDCCLSREETPPRRSSTATSLGPAFRTFAAGLNLQVECFNLILFLLHKWVSAGLTLMQHPMRALNFKRSAVSAELDNPTQRSISIEVK
jgi:hypothetical protein